MMGSTTPSVETLKAVESGRRLVSSLGRHEVAAKVFTDTEGNEYLVLRAWVGSHPGPQATAGWAEPSRWQHIVLNDDLDIVAVGTGARERDSFEMIKRALRTKGITAGGGEASTAKHLDEPDRAAAPKERLTRHEEDVEVATAEREVVARQAAKTPHRPHVKGLTSSVFDGVGTPDLRHWLKWWSAPERSPHGAEEDGRDPVAEQKKIRAEITAREQKPNAYIDAMDRRLPGSGWSNSR
jgi:hypothetical protein